MNKNTTQRPPHIAVAFIHHANQLLITDGYENRNGISTIAGTQSNDETGLLQVLKLHRRYNVPINLHISGTLLESLAWHCPDFFSELKRLAKLELLELLGSSYGQNMMKYFSYTHNLKQLNEELLLYKTLLQWEPERMKVFWLPERLWDTKALSAVLTDPRLQNGGYKYVIIDDRLLYQDQGNPSPRHIYDRTQTWDPINFYMYSIEEGHGLCALPIASNLRQNIPPSRSDNFDRVKSQMAWLLDISYGLHDHCIAIYADDMEKAAGVGWDPKGPIQYETVLKWISENKQLRTVKIGEWASLRSPFGEKPIERGTYIELMNEFGAGETFDNWYYDPRWAPYREYYSWAEHIVEKLASNGADSTLIELAWKVLLATSWQTAWHTPKTGAHGHTKSDEGPSAWIRAAASHSRLAVIVAEAAYWMKHKDSYAHTYLQDIDQDGDAELVVKNNALFGVFSPKCGGRLVYLFSVEGRSGRLVVGNPIDDWNLLEDLHRYMDKPANHPGAFSDVGYEHDNFDIKIDRSEGEEIGVRLVNNQKDSLAFGLEKIISLKEGQNVLCVGYATPDHMSKFSTEIGLTPDYLELLRHGHTGLSRFSPTDDIRGWSNRGVTVWSKLDNSRYHFWDNPRQEKFGHGYILRITSLSSRFTIWLGVNLENC